MTFVYDDVSRRTIYQNVKLLSGVWTGILNVAIFKYYLHKIRETILHRHGDIQNTSLTPEYFDILNAFLRHHIKKSYTVKMIRCFWLTP